MNIFWKRSALQSLIVLDEWRKVNGWPEIAENLVEIVESYFHSHDLDLFVPGRVVSIKRKPRMLRMTLISLRKSEPYKVFFQVDGNNIEIFLIRHPRQKPM